MRMRLLMSVVWMSALVVAGQAAPPVALEIATERGVQITAPHEWMQLLTSLGIDDVRIRGKRPGDEVQVKNVGSTDRPRYHVVGLLTSRDQLRLPGGTFSRRDRAALADYFDRLGTDGAESLTASRGLFGLTAKELASVTADLAQPIEFETKGQPAISLVERLQSKFRNQITLDREARRTLEVGRPIADELQGLTAGTAIAIVLRDYGLALRAEKLRGQPVTHRIVPADAETLSASTLGQIEDDDLLRWPIGWKPAQTPGRTVPELFELRNAEIDGYTLAEALAAISARVETPIYWDRAALRAKEIDTAAIQVRLPRARTTYKRVIDRVLAQARLHSEIRVDEAGTPFLWITR